MIIWSGKGILTLLILIFGIGISQSVYETISGLKPDQQDGDLMWACSFLIGLIGNLFLSRYLDKKPKRIVIDKETGQELELDQNGTLFFISIQKWTVIYAIMSLTLWIRFFLG